MRRWVMIAALLLAAAGVTVAALPFNPAMPRGTFSYGDGVTSSPKCASPVVGAWRADPRPSGWFGYAPLTDRAVPVALRASCRTPARHRLVVAGLLLGSGAFALYLSRRRFGGSPELSFS